MHAINKGISVFSPLETIQERRAAIGFCTSEDLWRWVYVHCKREISYRDYGLNVPGSVQEMNDVIYAADESIIFASAMQASKIYAVQVLSRIAKKFDVEITDADLLGLAEIARMTDIVVLRANGLAEALWAYAKHKNRRDSEAEGRGYRAAFPGDRPGRAMFLAEVSEAILPYAGYLGGYSFFKADQSMPLAVELDNMASAEAREVPVGYLDEEPLEFLHFEPEAFFETGRTYYMVPVAGEWSEFLTKLDDLKKVAGWRTDSFSNFFRRHSAKIMTSIDLVRDRLTK